MFYWGYLKSRDEGFDLKSVWHKRILGYKGITSLEWHSRPFLSSRQSIWTWLIFISLIICICKYRFFLCGGDHSPHLIISTLPGQLKSFISFLFLIVLGKLCPKWTQNEECTLTARKQANFMQKPWNGSYQQISESGQKRILKENFLHDLPNWLGASRDHLRHCELTLS